MEEKYRFPNNFFWGASTSAHQVEGHNKNDWSEWEVKNAEELASSAPRRLPRLAVWDDIKHDATDPSNYISGISIDQYHRYEEDFSLMKSLGLNSYRLSIEWSRIEPIEGQFDYDEINHYKEVIKSLRKRGIEPFVTLWHWPVPIWLRDKKGWLNRKSIHFFVRYAKLVAKELNDLVNFWITVNEIQVYTTTSYLYATWPPQHRNYFEHLGAETNLIRAHKKAYDAIKSINPNAKVGIANNMSSYIILGNPIFKAMIRFGKWVNNDLLFRRIKGKYDFIGLNYYFNNRFENLRLSNQNKIVSDLGWELYPEGIYSMLMDLKKYNTPIYITENGLADAKDQYREWYIKEILKNVGKAMKEGVDVRGYFHWSLIDNFEWSYGFWPRFGLIEVDYKNNLKRKVRKSAFAYAEIIKKGVVGD